MLTAEEVVKELFGEEEKKEPSPFFFDNILNMTGTQRRNYATQWEASVKEKTRTDRRQPVSAPPSPRGGR